MAGSALDRTGTQRWEGASVPFASRRRSSFWSALMVSPRRVFVRDSPLRRRERSRDGFALAAERREFIRAEHARCEAGVVRRSADENALIRQDRMDLW